MGDIVVHEDVDPSEPFVRRGDRSVDVVPVAHVARDGQRLAVGGGLNVIGQLSAAVDLATDDHHMCTCRRERHGHLLAQTSRTTGDERHFVGEQESVTRVLRPIS